MVKNLLNSGHNVSVWNRTTDKVRDFVEAGAKEALTPSDVIADSDITFSCVADPQAAKDLVFGNCGVLQEINTTKVRDKMKHDTLKVLRRHISWISKPKHNKNILLICFLNFFYLHHHLHFTPQTLLDVLC